MSKTAKYLLSVFAIWRISLFLIAIVSQYWIPAFGATFPYFDRVLTITNLPNWIWGFGNFDGVHYLRIAQDGYIAQFSQAFFPLFPLLIRIFSFIFPHDISLNTALFVDPAFFIAGLLLSNASFIASLFVFYKLLRLDFSEKISRLSIVFLALFPTSYYFGAVYTESLFFLLAVSAIYLIRKQKMMLAAVLIALASFTKVIGVVLIAVYLIELVRSKKYSVANIAGIIIAPLGLILYMLYLQNTFGNPIYFLTSQPVFGAQRSSDEIVLLPQVLFRYVKIFTSVVPMSLPFLNALLEFAFTVLPLSFLAIFYKKMRLSYFIFTLVVLLVPTLTGTLSSMPRYALSAFLLIPLLIERFETRLKLVFALFIFLAIVLISLFVRGYWVA